MDSCTQLGCKTAVRSINVDKERIIILNHEKIPILPSGVKLGELDLIKRVQESATLLDLRTVYSINVMDKRRIVELEVIGSAGSVIQDMGCEPVKISVFGEVMGPNSKSHIENIVNKFNDKKSIEFSSDLSSIPEISKVVVEDVVVQEVAGSPSRYKYFLTLKEYTERNGAQSGQQPSQAEAAAQDVAGAIANT